MSSNKNIHVYFLVVHSSETAISTFENGKKNINSQCLQLGDTGAQKIN